MRIFTLILGFFLALPLFAQRGKQDVVYLKNGSILRGTIVLQDPGKLIKLKTSDNSLWVFTNEQIDSITKPVKVRILPKTGYYNLTETGFLAGDYSNATRAVFTLINVNSWRFNNGLSAGIGAGVELSEESYLPVVADLRYFHGEKRSVPFVSLQAGYSISLGGSYDQIIYAIDDRRMSPVVYPGPIPDYSKDPLSATGGFLVNPAIGIQTPLNENLSMTFSAGYRYMRYSYTRTDYRLDIDYNRLSLKIGLLFK
jgi:opacity protein-like surface antigen